MKLLHYIRAAVSVAYNPKAFFYVPQIIEHLTNEQTGNTDCVFYDVAPDHPFDNILNDLVRFSRMQTVIKYIVNETYRSALEDLPTKPLLLLIHPGHDAKYLEEHMDINLLLQLFNPATKILVMVNHSETEVERTIRRKLHRWQFNSKVFFDVVDLHLKLSNAEHYGDVDSLIHPRHLYTYMERLYHGRIIRYVAKLPQRLPYPQTRWVMETAKYLNAEVHEYRHHCQHLMENAYLRCYESQQEELDRVDVAVDFVNSDAFTYQLRGEFRALITTLTIMGRVVVPVDRNMNPAEIIVKPFNWQVWMVVVLVLGSLEVLNHTMPNLFKNDPILLVVCGFERHNLHQTDRWEKIILHSAILLMFFMTNAFETKIISLMINKPPLQRIKTLDDIAEYGIKFKKDLQFSPTMVNHSVIGKFVVQGKSDASETEPGFGMYVTQDLANILPMVSVDTAKNRPWYSVLDGVYFEGLYMYRLSQRNPLHEVLWTMHLTLVEAGIMDFWERHFLLVGLGKSKQKRDIVRKVFLSNADLLPAWTVLAIGTGLSLVGFAIELPKKKCFN